ncbi:hypothetical protein MAA_11155 [Metarhizium robertsii ARSEF 23]|uniref:Uncharacterized protein n=1 Tax=Metarhizium robertsii (strain ARSEF 23 / ATCC MYA-3075) TaxID=655844 RepID=A0A0B2XF11_METRA|nr:uncharacterized protein MAA_11155 [Metarhizium robertsii ARSEF 23]KHO11340.1 hypothetical protein MAA_11155 [Metarhizium robertsii ARSEF 23]
MKPYACFTVALLGASVSAEQEAWSVTTIYHTVTTYLPYEQHRCSALFLPRPGNSQLPEAACRPGACCVQVVKENDYIQELVPTEGIGKTAPTGSPTTPKTTALTETKTLSQTPHKSSHGEWVPTQPPISYTENTTPKTTYSTTTGTTETFPRLETHVSSISTNGLRIPDIPALSSQHVSSRQGSGVTASPSTQQSTPSLTENSKGASFSKERGNVSNATTSSKSALPMKPSSTRACQSSFGSSSSSPRSHSSMSSRKPASSQLVNPSQRPSTSVAASSTKASLPGSESNNHYSSTNTPSYSKLPNSSQRIGSPSPASPKLVFSSSGPASKLFSSVEPTTSSAFSTASSGLRASSHVSKPASRKPWPSIETSAPLMSFSKAHKSRPSQHCL